MKTTVWKGDRGFSHYFDAAKVERPPFGLLDEYVVKLLDENGNLVGMLELTGATVNGLATQIQALNK